MTGGETTKSTWRGNPPPGSQAGKKEAGGEVPSMWIQLSPELGLESSVSSQRSKWTRMIHFQHSTAALFPMKHPTWMFFFVVCGESYTQYFAPETHNVSLSLFEGDKKCCTQLLDRPAMKHEKRAA